MFKFIWKIITLVYKLVVYPFTRESTESKIWNETRKDTARNEFIEKIHKVKQDKQNKDS